MSRALTIGYYVHHHGRGHATRAGVIGAALAARGHDVTYLGSGPLPDAGSRVVLERDDAGGPFVEAEASGALHWAPLGGGYAARSGAIAAWVSAARPDVVVVDVSVEVTALVRLLGVPVVVVAQPGRRDDAPHTLAYDLASAVLAPWPAGLPVADHLERVRPKVVETGGISRFADAAPARARTTAGRPQGLLLVGGAGWDDPTWPDRLAARTPEIAWATPDGRERIDTLLGGADVVVTHAGQNAVADVACFGVPAVVVPQARPFAEQEEMAAALQRWGLARGMPLAAGVDDVAAAVAEAMSRGGGAWSRWASGGAARRACQAIEGVVS